VDRARTWHARQASRQSLARHDRQAPKTDGDLSGVENQGAGRPRRYLASREPILARPSSHPRNRDSRQWCCTVDRCRAERKMVRFVLSTAMTRQMGIRATFEHTRSTTATVGDDAAGANHPLPVVRLGSWRPMIVAEMTNMRAMAPTGHGIVAFGRWRSPHG